MVKVICAQPFLSRHDAVSNDSRMQVEVLRAAGYEADLYAELFESGCESESLNFTELCAAISEPTLVLVVQMCVAWAQLDDILGRARCKIILRYHNITPPAYFAPYDAEGAFATRVGLEQMGRVIKHPRISMLMPCSPFTLTDCEQTWGPVALPKRVVATFMTLPTGDGHSDDEALKTSLHDGRVQLFFIGRWAPNKGHHHMIGVLSSFHELFGPGICLTIAGAVSANFQGYQEQITGLAKKLGVDASLRVVGGVQQQQLLTYLRHCTAFLLMSEHEGFCVPVIEAQAFGLPVLALKTTAVTATLGPKQLGFTKPDYDLFAAAARAVKDDDVLRQHVIANGYQNAALYSPKATGEQYLAAVSSLVAGPA